MTDHQEALARIKAIMDGRDRALSTLAVEAGVPYTTVHALARQGWTNKNLDKSLEIIARLAAAAERISANDQPAQDAA